MTLEEWIRGALHRLEGKTQAGLAKALRRDPSAVSRMLQGGRRITADEVKVIARYLGETPPLEVWEHMPASSDRVLPASDLEPVYIRGTVQAGHWLEAAELPEDEWEPVWVAPDPRFPAHKRYGLRVAGNSMDLVYPPGTILICVDLFAFGDGFGDVEPGRRVIVYRRRADGLIEATVKKLVVNRDGKPELWPESSSAAFQKPLRIDDVNEYETVEVVGVVIGSYREE